MSERTKLGMWTLAAALILAVAGDFLLRGVPWGVNVPLVAILLVALAAFPLWRGWAAGPERRWSVIFLVLALLLVVCVALRASPVLVALDVLGALFALSLVAGARRWRAEPRGVIDVAVGATHTGLLSAAGPAPVFARDIAWSEISPGGWPGGWGKPVLAVVRGTLIAVPLIVVFGTLLVAADAVFEELVYGIFDFDIARISGHVALISVLAWVSSGYLNAALLSGGPPELDLPRPDWLSLGLVEVLVALGSLNVLFLSFVVVQAGYLFGPEVAAGLTYSEYARRGFFELVAVAALVIPLLLATHWLLRRSSSRNLLVFRLLSGCMVALVFVMISSALWRMYLYFGELGLTELRLYTTAFMLWLGLVLLLFLVFTLRERPDRFAAWTLASGFVAVLVLNAINPDALIARANIQRALDDREFDPYYLTTLSEDAAPVVFKALPEIEGLESPDEDHTGNPARSPDLRAEALRNWSRDEETDWRSWNLARHRANNLASETSQQTTP